MFPSYPLIKLILEAPGLMYTGNRKIVQDITWEIEIDDEEYDHNAVFTGSYEDLGYGKNKHKQLVRNYVNPEEFERVKTILAKRRKQGFTSVALSMRGGKKDSRSMGWCMLNIVVTRKRGFESVEVQYRSTEAILKFGGDLVFIPWVFKELGLNPGIVRFRFANAFLAGIFTPTLFGHPEGPDPIKFLEYLEVADPELFPGGTRWLLRASYKKDQFFPYAPHAQQHRILWSTLTKRKIGDIRDFLEERHKKFDKPLPKLFHKEGEYVTRKQRRLEDDDGEESED